MKESFVFHAEYIDDLPEEYKSIFAMYAINYGLKDIEPELNGLELSIWLKIKRRIDSDNEAWESTKQKRSEAGKKGGAPIGNKNAIKPQEEEAVSESCPVTEAPEENKQKQAMFDLLESKQAKTSKIKQNQTKQAVNVNEFEFVIENDDVNEFVAPKSADSDIRAAIFKKLKEIQRDNCLNLTESQQNKITASLISNQLTDSFIDYVTEYLRNTYKTINSGMVYSALLNWEGLRADYLSTKTIKKQKKKRDIPELTTCINCGSSNIAWINHNDRFCKDCKSDFYFTFSEGWKIASLKAAE